jgi:hypothetical protein
MLYVERSGPLGSWPELSALADKAAAWPVPVEDG